METFTKIGTDWIINSNIIQEIIEKNPISEEKLIIIIKEYILEKLASNKNIIKNVLKRSENEYVPDFVFYIQLNPESTLIEINIKIEEVIQYYNDNKKNLKWWQKRACNKLTNNTSFLRFCFFCLFCFFCNFILSSCTSFCNFVFHIIEVVMSRKNTF